MAEATRFQQISPTRSVGLIVGWRKGKGVGGGTIVLNTGAAKIIRDSINAELDTIRSYKARRFEYEAEAESNQYFVAGTNLVSDESVIFAFVRSRESRRLIEADDLPDKNLWFYGVSVGGTAKTATIYFRKSNPYILLRQGSTFSLEGQGLVPFAKPLFKIDGLLDAILYEDEIVILRKNYFEQLFLDENVVEDRMRDTVEKVVSSIGMPARDVAALADFATHDPSVRRRLRAIHSRGVVRNATIEDIRAEIRSKQLVEADFIHDGKLYVKAGNELALVKLLNEDRYYGGISKILYDVDRKSLAGLS